MICGCADASWTLRSICRCRLSVRPCSDMSVPHIRIAPVGRRSWIVLAYKTHWAGPTSKWELSRPSNMSLVFMLPVAFSVKLRDARTTIATCSSTAEMDQTIVGLAPPTCCHQRRNASFSSRCVSSDYRQLDCPNWSKPTAPYADRRALLHRFGYQNTLLCARCGLTRSKANAWGTFWHEILFTS